MGGRVGAIIGSNRLGNFVMLLRGKYVNNFYVKINRFLLDLNLVIISML